MKNILPRACAPCFAILALWAAAGMAHAQDDVVIVESGSVHTLRLDDQSRGQILAAHDGVAVHAVAAADSSAADASEAGVDGGVSEVPAPAQIRAVAKCGDGSLVYSRHGSLCAEHGGITRLYQ